MCSFQEGTVITGKKSQCLLYLLAYWRQWVIFHHLFLEVRSRRALRKDRWFCAVSVPETVKYQQTCTSDLLMWEKTSFKEPEQKMQHHLCYQLLKDQRSGVFYQ